MTLSSLPLQAQPAPGIGTVTRVGRAHLSFLPHQLGDRDVALEGVWWGFLAGADPPCSTLPPMGESFSFIGETKLKLVKVQKATKRNGKGKRLLGVPSAISSGQTSFHKSLSHDSGSS